MKKIIILFFVVAATITASILFMRHINAQNTFTLEWHEINLQTYDTMKPTFEELQSVYVAAFLPIIKPHVYANDPRVANIPTEKRAFVDEKIVAGITEVLRSESWRMEISKLYAELQRNPPAYLVIAKDSHKKALGFALFTKERIKTYLASRLLSISEGSSKNFDSTHADKDEIYVSLLVVGPGTQKKGIGKALLFSVFDHCPHIKNIWLTTLASYFNKNAQAFYNHVGFTRILTGTFTFDKGETDWLKEQMIYSYQKP